MWGRGHNRTTLPMASLETQNIRACSGIDERSGGEIPRCGVQLEVPVECGVSNEGMIVHTLTCTKILAFTQVKA